MTDADTLTRPWALGDRVTYTDGGNDYTGTVVGIFTPVDTPHPSLWVASSNNPHDYSLSAAREGFADDGRAVWDESATGNNQGHWVSTRYENPRHVEPEPEPTPEVVPSLTAEEVTRLQAEVSDLRSQVSEAHDVIRLIGEALTQTAELHEWCGEYDRRATELADSLPSRYAFADTFRESAIREREYEVCVHWTVSHSTTVAVTASSQDDAVRLVKEDPTTYVEPLDRYSADSDSVSWDEIHVDD